MSKKKKDLKEIAQSEWGTDEKKPLNVDSAEAKKSNTTATLIKDPFQISTFDISQAQDEDEELILDEDLLNDEPEALDFDPKESDDQLLKLSEALLKENESNLEELKELIEQVEFNSTQELAKQIEEDKALEVEEKKAQEQANEELNQELKEALPHVDETGALDFAELQSCLETLLFLSEKPLSLKKLKELLSLESVENTQVEEALSAILKNYQKLNHGFELVEVAGGYQFRTKAARSALAHRLVKVQAQRLSRGAMESLAIIAYKQPVLKEDIDQIRGVDSSHFIRTLLDKKLIEMRGRSELPGRPIVYGTTQEFLEVFNLKDLGAMPPLQEIEKMIPASEAQFDDEDPKVKQMRKLVQQMKSDDHRIQYDPKEDERILEQFREHVKAIPSSTPYLEELRAQEKEEKSENKPSLKGQLSL